MTIENKLGYFNFRDLKIEGVMIDYVRLVMQKQLYDVCEWEHFVDAFRDRKDVEDGFWRGEFFGKQMRGAVLVYQVTGDEKLYEIMTATVERLLNYADEYGRLSTYPQNNEFFGWDLWGRKYVLVGLEYYYEICRSAELKKRIIDACKAHVDYIISKIGVGKKSIVETSSWWGCVNSCTILEPVVQLYKLTGEQRYLDFAKYILSTGGSADCDFLKAAFDEELMPYQYPVTKAYEVMSFHEGVLAYYEVTGDRYYFDVADRFFEKVSKSDLTIIGCSGCENELFNHSSVTQTDYSEDVMQETCVTVTWMRIMSRLYLLTGDKKYVDRIETSGLNALYSSLNTKDQSMFYKFGPKVVEGKIFDSYSPLYKGRRGRQVGGYCEFEDGTYGGCCIVIGACGMALMPLNAVLHNEKGIVLNYFFQGRLNVKDINGKAVSLVFRSSAPYVTDCSVTVECDGECNLSLMVRKPEWGSLTATLATSGKASGSKTASGDYLDLSGAYKNGDEIKLQRTAELVKHSLNGKIAFTYGPYVLAFDERKQKIDFDLPIGVKQPLEYEFLKPEEGELIRLTLKTDKDEKLLLTDYESCGKYWDEKPNLVSVWVLEK